MQGAGGAGWVTASDHHGRFQPPRSGPEQVRRRKVLLPLQKAPPRRLTTIVAPAGYGKTSLAAQWRQALDEEGVATAWLSLESDDRDQSHFLASLIECLDRSSGRSAAARDFGALSVSALLRVLSTRLKEGGRELALFLDDYHHAQTDATEALVSKLLADAGMAHVRLVLISRSRPRFPVSALRLKGELREVGVESLRFSVVEAQDFFGATAARLSASQIEELVRHTEGWAVALQMVRMLIAEEAGNADIWRTFRGVDADMGRYLLEQVIANLPERIRLFLFETAVLPSVSAELAAVVTGDPAAFAVFRELGRYALPISMRDSSGQWVRYHPVFREFLIEEAARQGMDGRARLVAAAAWFQERGESHAAVRHALLADDVDLAARIVEREGGWRLVYLTARGGAAIFRAMIEKAAQIDLQDYPLTTLGFAITSAKAGYLEAANHYLGLVEAMADPTPEIDRQLRVVRALLSLYNDTRLNDTRLSELENDLMMGRELELVHRGLLLNLLSFNYLNRTRLERAIVYGELAMRCLKDCGAEFGALHLHIHIGQAAFFGGNVVGAGESYSRLIEDARASFGTGSDMEAIAQVLWAELVAERGDFEGVRGRLGWALAHVERHDTWFDILAAGFMTRQRAALIEGDFAEAHAAIDAARAAASRRGFERLRRLIDAEQVRLLIAAEDLDDAARFARHARMDAELAQDRAANDLSLRLRGPVPALLWVRLWIARGELDKARAALTRLRTMQSERLHVPRRIEIELLEIRLALAEGRRAQAAQTLADLVLSAPLADYRASTRAEGTALMAAISDLAGSRDVAPVVRQRVAALFAPVRRAPAAEPGRVVVCGAGVDLTAREQGIIRLLSAGHTNKNIGRKLKLTDNTVKFHLRNIFAKLGVSTRTGAVSAARELGLLR